MGNNTEVLHFVNYSALKIIWSDQSDLLPDEMVWNKIVDCGHSLFFSLRHSHDHPILKTSADAMSGVSRLQMTLQKEQTAQRVRAQQLY